MRMSISPDVVRHIARLARLHVDDAEIAALARELEGMLAHFGQVASIDTEGIEATSHVAELPAALRADEVSGTHDELTQAKLLQVAPGSAAPFFRVPRFRKGAR